MQAKRLKEVSYMKIMLKPILAMVVGLLVQGLPANVIAQTATFTPFLESTIQFDEPSETITLPLYMGMHNGSAVWYIVTESSDQDDAAARGVNWSPRLANALGTSAVQTAGAMDGMLVFSGTVDFTPLHVLQPGPTGFPPAVAMPGSTGDSLYSPLVTSGDGVVLNAPHVANGTGMHDKVVSIDFNSGTVALAVTAGFYHGKRIFYLSTDSSDPVGATLEASTFAPNLNAAPGLAATDADDTSARASIIAIVNGATGIGNPDRQGLQSAVFGEGSPLNITRRHPGAAEYSPLWDVHPAVWTDEAIAAGERSLMDHHQDVADAVLDGLIISGGTGPMNEELGGLRAAGFIVNCPVMAME
jgi:hypothetical protein